MNLKPTSLQEITARETRKKGRGSTETFYYMACLVGGRLGQTHKCTHTHTHTQMHTSTNMHAQPPELTKVNHEELPLFLSKHYLFTCA